MKKSIITSCPFPLIKLTVNIKFAEIEKPSGIGYIILVLIKDTKNHEEMFNDVLFKQLGVPEDIQSIFSDEMELLLNREILRLKQGFEYKYEQRPEGRIFYRVGDPKPVFFEDAKLGYLEFTENGERMFREGFIPTGEEKSKQATLYFNPLTMNFSFNVPKNDPMNKSACYTPDFMEQVRVDLSGIKDYLIENVKQAGLLKEERLLDCSIVDQEYLITAEDKNLDMLIDEYGMELNFKTAGARAFFNKYFTREMFEHELDTKSMFKFKVPMNLADGFSEFKNLSAIYAPEEYTKQIARPARLLITDVGGRISVKRGNVISYFNRDEFIGSAVNAVFPRWSFITVDAKEMRFYTAAKVNITERVIGKPVNINLLIEQIYGTEQKQPVIKALFDECKAVELTPEFGGLIKVISELDESTDYMRLYIKSRIAEKSLADQSEILLDADKIFLGVKWAQIARDCANKIYDAMISELTKENAGYYVKLARTLDKIRKPGQDELYNAVSGKLSKEISDEVELFNAMLNAGFSEAITITEKTEEKK
jgi:hypothetical protein